MKKILRTKLQYNCSKTEEFNYGLNNWYTKYDRSFDMYVSASTKEDCEKTMESFEDTIRTEGIQDCFESNITPEYDEKKKLWVGVVEVYVGNDYVADEKEAIKEVYREWKEQLKKAPAPEVKEEATEETQATPTGYKSQEERVEEMIENLELGKEYKVDDGAGTKMIVVKKENGVWWGNAVWNKFSGFKLDYQEYILDLIFEKEKTKKCIKCKWYTACYNSDERYNEEFYKVKITKPCEDYKEIGGRKK